MSKVLVADDDPHIREVITFALAKEGFSTCEAENGNQALQVFDHESPDLVVLDIMMPEMNGTDVCRTLRENSTVPIVFVSSKDEELDRILGLELGGDDYITKPFSPRELVARVRAVLRRTASRLQTEQDQPQSVVLKHGRLALDESLFKAFWSDQEVVLTVTEFGVLRTLIAHPGKVYTRDALMDGSYDLNKVVSDRTIDSHVRRVRAKFKALGADPIETVHGLGYKLSTC